MLQLAQSVRRSLQPEHISRAPATSSCGVIRSCWRSVAPQSEADDFKASQLSGTAGKSQQPPRENIVRAERCNSGNAAGALGEEPIQHDRQDVPSIEGSGEAEDAGSRQEVTKPVSELNHEEEFERAWADPRITRVELPPVDINLVLAKYYRTNEPLSFTRTMLWDMEVKKAYRPDLYIPSVVLEGSARYWRPRVAANGAVSFVRSSQQRLWLEPQQRGLVLEQVAETDRAVRPCKAGMAP